jgi:hypothetical protein
MVVGILDALKEGPLTRAAICRELGAEHRKAVRSGAAQVFHTAKVE